MDWRKKENYEYTNGLPPEGWAWEFLRRNKAYRNDYQEYKASLNKITSAKNPSPQNTHVYIPDIMEGESEDTWRKRIWRDPSNPEPRKVPLSKYLGEKWRIQNGIQDPDQCFYGQVIFSKHLAKIDTSIENQLDLYFEFEDNCSCPLFPENGNAAHCCLIV